MKDRESTTETDRRVEAWEGVITEVSALSGIIKAIRTLNRAARARVLQYAQDWAKDPNTQTPWKTRGEQ